MEEGEVPPPLRAPSLCPATVRAGATTTGPDATPPPAICQNLGGGGWGGQFGGGQLEGVGGGFGRGGGSAVGGVPKGGGGAVRDPLLPHAYLQGGMCVWVFGGTEVCM